MLLAHWLIGILIFSFVSCSNKQSDKLIENSFFLEVFTPTFIEKLDVLFESPRMEATPFLWNGNLMYVVFNREEQKIEIWNNLRIVTTYETDLGLGSAIVVNSKLYIYATKDWATSQESNGVYQITTTDLLNFSEPVLVIGPSAQGVYFNTSIDRIDDENFIMAIEECRPNKICFSVRFLTSNLESDLTEWVSVGNIFKENEYTACPTIRYIDGVYYVFYLRYVGHFATYISKSTDLIDWTHSEQVVLSAHGAENEGVNNSDFDLIEFEGQTYLNYAIGDQLTWTRIKSAKYNGTLSQFVSNFF